INRDGRARDEKIPARQVKPRESQITGSEHERQKEISQNSGNRRDQKEKNHDDAVDRKGTVVGLGLKKIAGRRQQLEADEKSRHPADNEKKGDGDHVEKRDSFVIGGEEPRLPSVGGVDVIFT